MIERILKFVDCSRSCFPGGITQEEAEILAEATGRVFGCRLPDEVLAVLREINGFSADGTTFFSFTNDEIRTNFRRMIPRDLLYNNKMFREDDGDANYLLFARTELSYFAVDIRSGRYVLISTDADEVIRTFDSFDEVMRTMLTEN